VSAQGSLDRTLHLSGEVRGTAPVLRLGTQVVSVDNTISAHAGESFAVSLMAFDEIGDSSGLNTLEGVLHFNPDLLICRGVTAASGWDLITARGAEIGVLSLQLERQAGVATNGELAQVRFEPRVADSTATDIHLTDVRLNADDPTFERCMLSSIVSAPTVRFVVSDSCGTRLMRDKLRGVPILDLVGISPNPAERGSAVQVTVYTTNSDKLMVRLISSTGEVLKSIEVAAASGLNTFDLPIVGIPSGPTVIVVSSDLETRSRKLVIR
jgi:hypothetical protein